MPSRVRSPTPAKTDTPPCSCATLWISSWISTVLPRPAPPNSPTFPPWMNGASRSITFRPVSKTSIFGESSVNFGGSRWIDQRSVSSGGAGFSSTGSPMTFQMRPSVTSPTGTEIGCPVSWTSSPRARPSVESIATARRRSSPRCCCTSAIRVPGLLLAERGDLDPQRRVDLRETLGEHGVDHDALDLDDLAGLLDALFGHESPATVERTRREPRGLLALEVYRDAPETSAVGGRLDARNARAQEGWR